MTLFHRSCNRMQIRIIVLVLIFPILGIIPVEAGELLAREPLDALWEQNMLENMLDGDTHTSVHMEIRRGVFHKSERPAKEPSGYWARKPWNDPYETRDITVAQYGEGFWGNGGWLLNGGLVGRAKEGASTIELYGKAIVHRFPYFPFPFPRHIPHETGFEFFLLQREGSYPRATVVRKWTIPPQEVVKVGPPGLYANDVQATFEYDSTQRERSRIRASGSKIRTAEIKNNGSRQEQ